MSSVHPAPAYLLVRDAFLFTDRRLILVDKQGLTGKKIEYHTVPYRTITHFSVETAGTFDLDAELKIWLSGSPVPIAKQFGAWTCTRCRRCSATTSPADHPAAGPVCS